MTNKEEKKLTLQVRLDGKVLGTAGPVTWHGMIEGAA